MNHTLLITGTLALMLTACGSSSVSNPVATDNSSRSLPADHFDLSHWNITVPLDQNSDGKVDTVKVADIQSFPILTFSTPMRTGILSSLLLTRR